MWICMNDAYLSIVEAKGKPNRLLVRARVPGHIERVFPQAEVITLARRDYMFRAEIPRQVVADAIAARLIGISYGNFKDSVPEARLHDAYAEVWGVMARLQPIPPYAMS